METKVKILVDYREANSPVVEELRNYAEVELANLDAGDYVISKRCSIERKTCGDFAKSIVDGRLFQQLKKLVELYELPILLVEGSHLYASLSREAIMGAIATVISDFRVPVLRTKTPTETTHLILALAKREQSEQHGLPRLRTKPKFKDLGEAQEFLLAGLPGIDRKYARRLLERFGTPLACFNASLRELMEIRGIGIKTARRIREILTSKYKSQREKQTTLY